ncbi:hypothetical protein DNFV4_02724 [Nitrospira tepida]|uniref:Uncharacterized protein n=1 Tax=Nitrospira tepida TaxID=2973512 RepID=A0AA86T559_9BACT|nr:hypothetical protein DNFV4_02724 [Nitrospira tepida]
MQGISWRRKEIEAPVKFSGRLIFGMDHQGTNSCNVGSLESPEHRVLQQSSTDPLFLPAEIDG